MRLLGHTADGAKVFNRHTSHNHVDSSLLSAAIARASVERRFFTSVTVEFGEPVGYTECVETTDTDDIVYAVRLNRTGHTRFVTNRQPLPSSKVTLILKQIDQSNNDYVLVTAFIGGQAEPEPFDPKATERAWDYWSKHALVWCPESIDSSTVTRTCPWIRKPGHGRYR